MLAYFNIILCINRVIPVIPPGTKSPARTNVLILKAIKHDARITHTNDLRAFIDLFCWISFSYNINLTFTSENSTKLYYCLYNKTTVIM